MASRHWFQNDAGEYFLEPDFYEYIGGGFIGSIHRWKSGDRFYHEYQSQFGGALPNVEEFFVAGALSQPGKYSWWVNNAKMGEKSPPWLSDMSSYRGPIMVGSGPSNWFEIDWIRVWTPA